MDRERKLSDTGYKHLTGGGLTYRNALHMYISILLKFG